MGQFKSAIADFTTAISLNPNYLSAYNNRGNAYASIGEHDRAIADFTRVISIDSSYADTYYNRALVYFFKKNYELALKDLKKYRTLGHQVPEEFLKEIYRALENKN